MTDKEAMKLVLEAQQIIAGLCADKVIDSKEENILRAAIKQALAAPAQPEQEPVAHCKVRPLRGDESFPKVEIDWVNQPVPGPLFTTPPQRKPLTNGEIYTAYITATNQTLRAQDERLAFVFARAIEAAHGIKENT
jgi:hypothetical protein